MVGGTQSYKAMYYMRHEDADVNIYMVILRDWLSLFKMREIDRLHLTELFFLLWVDLKVVA